MASEYDIVHVVRCKDCIHYDEDGECDMWEYDVVKPYGFCWYGQTADGRTSVELDAEPVVRCKDCIYRTKEDSPFYRLMKGYCDLCDMFVQEDFYCASGTSETSLEKYHNKIKASSIYGEMKDEKK